MYQSTGEVNESALAIIITVVQKEVYKLLLLSSGERAQRWSCRLLKGEVESAGRKVEKTFQAENNV